MSTPPTPLALLRHALLADGRIVDVVLDGATVSDLLPAGTAPVPVDPTAHLDLDGYLLLTAPAEPHAHLDKARSWDAIRPPMGDLASAITAWRAYAATMTHDDIVTRARTQALAMLAKGTTAIRSHVDVHTSTPRRGIEALVEVRNDLTGLIDLEIVALCDWRATDAEVDEAIAAGADTVGGAPHLSPEPMADLDRLLTIAERHGLPVDLHTDESLAGTVTLDEYARRTADWPQNRSAGHCVRLGTMPADERDSLIGAVVASRIGVIANPITNLYLQGWESPVATPRGLAPARALLEAGARFAAGADNVRDPFNPLGRSDALETAMLLVVAAHLTADDAYAAVSNRAREVLGLPPAGAAVGHAAEFLAVRAGSVIEAVAEAPADRIVIHAGRLVARTTIESRVADPTPLIPTGAR